MFKFVECLERLHSKLANFQMPPYATSLTVQFVLVRLPQMYVIILIVRK